MCSSCFTQSSPEEADPVHRAKTRIQALPADAKGKGKADLSMFAVLLRIFKKEGIFGFYRGFGATMLNTFSMRTWGIH